MRRGSAGRGSGARESARCGLCQTALVSGTGEGVTANGILAARNEGIAGGAHDAPVGSHLVGAALELARSHAVFLEQSCTLRCHKMLCITVATESVSSETRA